jgi:cobalt/nickel transport system permease protein
MDPPISIAGYILAGLFLAIALKKVDTNLGEKAAPLMGVIAAFIFAGQMINFPVAGGTSGHLLGGALAAILIGPWAAIIAMAAVVCVQALIFQDGGIAVMGVNVFNMGVVTAISGYYLYTFILSAAGNTPVIRSGAAFAAAWLSVMLAAALTSVELAASGTSPLDVALPAMLGVHALIGIGEGLITAAAVTFVQSTRPDLLEGYQAPAAAEVRA